MKTKSKSLISIILSIMMVLSMVIVAVPVNAATVEDSSVGDTTYYFWYSFGETNIGSTGDKKWTKITMTSAGNSTFTATLDVNTGYSMYFNINTNSSNANSATSTWSSTDDVKKYVTFTNDVKKSSFNPQQYGANSSGGSHVSYYFPGFSLSSAQKLTFTFTPSKKVVVSTATTTTTYTVSKASTSNGTFSVDKTSAAADATVTVTTKPNTGYEVDKVTVTKTGGSSTVTASSTATNKYQFTMPAYNVTVTVTFKAIETPATNWYISGSQQVATGWPGIGLADPNYKMISEGKNTDNDDIYSLTYTFPSNVLKFYVVVNDGTDAYHPAETTSVSGTPADLNKTNKTPDASPSWYLDGFTAGMTVKLTWNATDKSLSWEEVVDDTSYNVSVSNTDTNGTVACTTTSAKAGDTVNFTVTPKEGYTVDTVTVTGATATKGTTTDGTTTYSFTMPAQNVTISATFKAKVEVSSKWSLVGDFNGWVETENPMKDNNGTYTTSLYLPANSTGYDFKILNNEATGNEHGFYGKLNTEIPDTTNGVTLDNTDSVHSSGNVVLKTSGGVYTFTWVESTKKLTVAKGSTYTLTASDTIPATIGAGEELNMTINASSIGTVPAISYYKYTVKAGSANVAKGVKNANSSYNCKTTLSANSTITYFVKAYNEAGELIGLTATGSKDVTVTVGNFKVDLRVDKTEVILKETFTLTATVDPAGYAGSYTFYQSNDGESYTALGTASTASTKTVSISTKGKYYFKVEVTNKYDATKTVESYRIDVDVYETASPNHSVDIYFKSASSFIYKPTLTLDGTVHEMSNKFETVKDTEGNVIIQPFIGNAYSGSLKFYWFKVTITFDSTKDNTITFKTGRTQVNASFTSRFLADEYYFAVDNLMSGRTVYNLTTANEAIRNFYHSPLNMVTMGDTSDGNLGFTNVNGQTVKMGSILTATVDVTGATVIQASFSIRSATVAQKIAAEIEEVSDTQYSLLDVNLDGNVDVRDATLMQKALVNA